MEEKKKECLCGCGRFIYEKVVGKWKYKRQKYFSHTCAAKGRTTNTDFVSYYKKKKGKKFKPGGKIVSLCRGCKYITERGLCRVYESPAYVWGVQQRCCFLEWQREDEKVYHLRCARKSDLYSNFHRIEYKSCHR